MAINLDEPAKEHHQTGANVFGICAAAQVFGLLAVGLIGIWCGRLNGGLGWTDANQRFNWHPFLMIFGLVWAYGNGMIIYRVQRSKEMSRLKIIHSSINSFALLCAIIGMSAVFSHHNEKNIPNMYTIHSWIGLGVIVLFIGMLASGVIFFLFPGIPQHLRAKVHPLHIFTGHILLALIVATVISGIKEQPLPKFITDKGPKRGLAPPETLILNFARLAVVIFAILVAYLTTQPQFKRPPQLDEEQKSSQHEMEKVTDGVEATETKN